MKKITSTIAITTALMAMASSAALAQAPTAATIEPRSFVQISGAGQLTSRSFNTTLTFTSFNETGTVATNENLGKGGVISLGGGRRMWGNFGLGVGLWFGRTKGSSASTALIPNPLLANDFATVTRTATGLDQHDTAVDINVFWMKPLSDRMLFMFAIGPSIIHVSQDIGSIAVAPGTQNATPSSTTESATTGKAGNATFELTYMLNQKFGGAVFARYAGGEVKLPSVDSLKVGGVQVGGGIRIHF